ncbi:MAG: TOBE domain-containing protein [Comamonadaceae bacterium]|nr:TOBE domain-containing protein [Comamonadaceae bacterium]
MVPPDALNNDLRRLMTRTYTVVQDRACDRPRAQRMTRPGHRRFLQIQDVVKDFDGYQRRQPRQPGHRQGRDLRAARPVGLRQEHAAAHAGRLRDADLRAHRARRPATSPTLPPYERPMNMMFQSYALFPHLTVWDNIAFGLQREGLPKDQHRRARRGDAQAGAARQVRQAQAAPALRRPAAARGAGAQPGQAAAAAAARRAAGRARQEAARGDADRARQHHRAGRRDLRDGHARPGRGHDDGLAHRRHERGPLPAGRRAGRHLRDAGHALRRRLHRQRQPDGRHARRSTSPTTCVIDCADCQHYVGHGITGTAGHAGDGGAAAREDPPVAPQARPSTSSTAAPGTIKEMSYFGSFTVYHLELASGALLKVSQANVAAPPRRRVHLGRRGLGALVALGPRGADAVSAPMSALHRSPVARRPHRRSIARALPVPAGVLPAAVPDRRQDQRLRDGDGELQGPAHASATACCS